MKQKIIQSLSLELKQIEIDYCHATRGGDREAADALWVERGEVIRELARIK